MLRGLNYRMVKFRSSSDLCVGLLETSRAAETSAALWETWCRILTIVVLSIP